MGRGLPAGVDCPTCGRRAFTAGLDGFPVCAYCGAGHTAPEGECWCRSGALLLGMAASEAM